ncbi:aminopeptidase P N-terminal domain-containing protein [Chromobacterium violaceum]|uniref:aminopeptidase P N-terminal domain-containing protein n=1 Tax=Chromobacterium violaceum TaxID=536 RepID=UPI0005BAC0E5|nr:aminopeptidase P N-terminal domain-containing protein [Chromobacterium violaceum]MBP4048011.1 aminopeptidase P N-terminal domain-containing protein [Chromobacterium violaceum]MBX9268903.1 aminopeptidase P N-terminal domain-containing protein [Chromobacterium violaceum]OQS23093.1 peptidase M24 family protein [Chromobacterium violaceum]
MHQPHAERRKRLLAQIGDGVALLSTAPVAVRNADNHYPYRADSHFLYLTGFEEPEAVLLLDGRSGHSVLFCRDRNPEMEIWDGFRYGPDGAKEVFGFDESYPLSEMAERVPDLLADRSQLWWPLGHDEAFDRRVNRWLDAVRGRSRAGARPPAHYGDLRALLDEMRMVKDEAEIALLRRAGEISAAGHVQAMRAARPGMREYQLEAELLHVFVGHGARQPAYESIVAAGANACTLHYVANNARINDGELLLIDAGCEYRGYAGDITRTFPANGRFSGPQRDVYEIVLAAQQAGIDAVKPGAVWHAPSDAALEVLAQGMVDLGLLAGSADGVIESGAYRQFYMHGIGHLIGLDVHDVGQRKHDGQWRRYQPGMCTTIEPGLYIRPAPGVPEAFHGIGVRIEDNVLVTADGNEVYTAAAPKTVAGIEALMRGE